MADLLIRDLGPEAHQELKRRAASEGVSLQTYVVRLLTRHAERPDRAAWFEALNNLEPVTGVSGADAVAAARDELP